MKHYNKYTYKDLWSVSSWTNDNNTLTLFIARMGDTVLRAYSKHLIEQRIDRQEHLWSVSAIGWDDGRFGCSDCHYQDAEEVEAYNEGYREGWNSRFMPNCLTFDIEGA